MFERNDLKMRHELKYPLGRGEYAALRQRCRTVLKSDPHADENGQYTIESLYFDDLEDSALMANFSGLSRRRKFRIRRYNGDNATLHLEKKVKNGGLGTKLSCPMTEDELTKLLAGNLDWMKACGRPLMEELYVRMVTERLRPKVLVAYRREPYIYRPGNVRITFDFDIRSGISATGFDSAVLVPTNPGLVLMEVKYDAFLPDLIQDLLQVGSSRVQAFSKYAVCRQYDF